jgi:hypothetical protein
MFSVRDNEITLRVSNRKKVRNAVNGCNVAERGEIISHPSPNAKSAHPMRVSAVRDGFSPIPHPSRSLTLLHPTNATDYPCSNSSLGAIFTPVFVSEVRRVWRCGARCAGDEVRSFTVKSFGGSRPNQERQPRARRKRAGWGASAGGVLLEIARKAAIGRKHRPSHVARRARRQQQQRPVKLGRLCNRLGMQTRDPLDVSTDLPDAAAPPSGA